jgi:hypothetical protein
MDDHTQGNYAHGNGLDNHYCWIGKHMYQNTTEEVCIDCPLGMIKEEDNTKCGSCVNDPNDCSNYYCEACPANMHLIDNGECCGTCKLNVVEPEEPVDEPTEPVYTCDNPKPYDLIEKLQAANFFITSF